MTDDRARLLAGLPLTERWLDLAGVPTVVLEGGSGAPMVLLHGPGEFGLTWLPVLEELARTHRLVVPDLPGHGASGLPDGDLDTDVMLRWLDELIVQACTAPPVVVGRVVGGAIAARHAIQHPGRSAGLVLVDTLGLVPFAPNPRFMLAMQRFLAQPTEQTYERFMALCAFDVDGARQRLGNRWEPFARYAVDLAARPGVQAAMGAVIRQFALPIPPESLDRIDVPTTLVWGREDLATPVAAAEAAAARHGWPLHVIPDAGDDPALDQPDAFLQALRHALELEKTR
jgi:pimeloyl-ACP methyl ester carboxylesterase